MLGARGLNPSHGLTFPRIQKNTDLHPSHILTLTMAVSVLRRYTPPTCTLEIMAKKSPLSQWTDRTVLKDLRFRLALDGPHLLSDQHVRVQGDRHQLEILCDVVEAYIQQMLSQSASQFHSTLFQALPQNRANSSRAHLNSQQHPVPLPPTQLQMPLPPTQLEQGQSLVPPDVMREQPQNPISIPDASTINQTGGMGIVIPSGLALLPCGKLKHELWLGLLANHDSGPSVQLSTLELFDLANALEQYKADTLSVPDLEQKGWLQSTPPWMRAVAVLVFAVGVTTAVTEILQQSNSGPVTSEAPIAADAEVQSTQEREDLAALAPSSREEAGLSESSRLNSRIDRARQNTQDDTLPLDDDDTPLSTGTDESSSPADSPSDAPSNGAGNDASDRSIPPELAAIPPIDQQARSRLPIDESESRERNDSGAIAFDPAASVPNSAAQQIAVDSAASSDEAFSGPAESAPAAPSLGALPQIDEIRAYFQQSWQPPEDLDRPVEYRLVLNPDGTLAQVTPLGQTARVYAGQTGMPAIGVPFVSQLENQNMPQIRLVLQPNGQVRAFLESWN